MKSTITIIYRTAMALLAAVLLALPLQAAPADTAGSAAVEEEVDVKAIVLEHLSDSYWWHIGTFGGRDVSLYLPVIVRSSAEGGGWHCFSSRHLAAGTASPPVTWRTERRGRDSALPLKENMRGRSWKPCPMAAWSGPLTCP